MSRASPVVTSTYELVHIALLNGKKKFQTQPRAKRMMPKKNRPETLFSDERAVLSDRSLPSSLVTCPLSLRISHVPASTPEIVVTIAPIVDSNPSGSYTLPKRHMCGSVMIIRSTYAARLHALSLIVVTSHPGTGIIVMMNQYP